MSQRRINIIITLLASVLFFVLFFDEIVMINGPATSSIVYRPFSGGVSMNTIYGEGIYLVWPWNRVYKFNTREQVVQQDIHIMVQNGVTVTVLINYRYRPVVDSLPAIFRKFGVEYDRVFVNPEVVANTRNVISHYKPETIYTLQIDSIRNYLLQRTHDTLLHGNVNLTSLEILNIELPPKVVEAIENKLTEEQLSQEYDFKIQIAQKQRTITVINAEAIKTSEDTINSGLTPDFIRYRQVEALQNLSTSSNAKTIVVQPGVTLPLYLNGQ